jgi:hypothetical protein
MLVRQLLQIQNKAVLPTARLIRMDAEFNYNGSNIPQLGHV